MLKLSEMLYIEIGQKLSPNGLTRTFRLTDNYKFVVVPVKIFEMSKGSINHLRSVKNVKHNDFNNVKLNKK